MPKHKTFATIYVEFPDNISASEAETQIREVIAFTKSPLRFSVIGVNVDWETVDRRHTFTYQPKDTE